MNFKEKSQAFLLTGSVIALLLLLWLFMRSTDRPPDKSATANVPLVEDQQAPAEEKDPADEAGLFDAFAAVETLSETATTEPSSSTTRSQPDVPATLTAEQIVYRRETETQMEAAFAGDNNEAAELSRFLNQCQMGPKSKEGVEQAIERAAESFAAGKPPKQFRRSQTIQEFDSLESFELEKWDSFYRCDAARGLINDDFWDRLEREADAGNPVARYLFATLQREPAGMTFRFDQWEEELELSEQSREYTWRNMEEREPLGLLAMAQTGRFGTRVTMGGVSVNVVLSLAAIKCGVATSELLDQANQMIENLKRLEVTQPGALDQLNSASDEAKRMFCK